MNQQLRVLLVEDQADDAKLILDAVKRAGFDPVWQRVQTDAEYRAALSPDLDVILADFVLPAFSAIRALDALKDTGLDVPFIIVSGSIGEEAAIEALHGGASDYLQKDRLTRLGQAIHRTMAERRLQRDKHTLEEQYRQSQKMEAVGQLAGGIAHDFNNLLTAIQGYCELLSEMLPPGSVESGHLDEVRLAADRAAALTRQLLAFGRRQILEPRVLDPRACLREIEPLLRRLIGEDIDIIFRASDDVANIKADPGQIQQVLMNLAINARDAMPNGGTLVLEVSHGSLDEEFTQQYRSVTPGHHVLFTVSDTGIGMSEETQARIFEPFFTTKQKGKGTGLGLATVYGIVKQSGGSIWVSSTPGRGTTFKVYLPRVEEATERPAAAERPQSLRGRETILVVEDEEIVRQLVRKILQRLGYNVIVVGTPQQALDIPDAERLDLLISDVVLPHMSGRAVADQLRARRPGLRVLFMSGYTDDAIVHRGVLDPDTPFIQKPFTPEALAHRVRQVLDGQQGPEPTTP
jgi:two-component system cell cycle sensor histidine kinase/response regulator CckA